MITNTQEQFKTEAQYKRWLQVEAFFKKMQAIQKKGITIWYIDDNIKAPMGKIIFKHIKKYNEIHIEEQYKEHSFLVWVGNTHDFCEKRKDYMYLFVNETVKQLIKKYKFSYYTNEIVIKGDL